MADPQTLPELVTAAQTRAKLSQDRISEILTLAEGQTLSDALDHEMASEIRAVELTAVDIFTVFEARMQRHFKRGPLSRKVKAALLAAGNAELAERLHQYYLAINVLKHGTGASHRELLNSKSTLFGVTRAPRAEDDTPDVSTSLIDVTPAHFFDGLATTILEATDFLENR